MISGLMWMLMWSADNLTSWVLVSIIILLNPLSQSQVKLPEKFHAKLSKLGD